MQHKVFQSPIVVHDLEDNTGAPCTYRRGYSFGQITQILKPNFEALRLRLENVPGVDYADVRSDTVWVYCDGTRDHEEHVFDDVLHAILDFLGIKITEVELDSDSDHDIYKEFNL